MRTSIGETLGNIVNDWNIYENQLITITEPEKVQDKHAKKHR